MMASVYHRIINGRNKCVGNTRRFAAPRMRTIISKRVIRKKRTRESQLNHATTFCVNSIQDALAGPPADGIKNQNGLVQALSWGANPSAQSSSLFHRATPL